MDRRKFLKTSGTGFAAGLLSSFIVPKWSMASLPSNQIRVGMIGVGGRGMGVMRGIMQESDAKVVAVCDVDKQRCDKAAKDVREKNNPDVQGYSDFRRILERKDVDAIAYGTPDHWHALNAVMAFQAGKDVYGEKPLCHNYNEAVAMLKTGERYARVFQLGTQIHATDNYHRVVELVRSGILGEIHTVRVWKNGGSKLIKEQLPQSVPNDFDYEMWLGPAPWRPYSSAHIHFNWRYFMDFSTGMYADFWCHLNDLPFWALDLGAPQAITATGEFQSEGIANVPKSIDVELEYTDMKLQWMSKKLRDWPESLKTESRGCCFEGTKGKLYSGYQRRAIFLDGKEYSDIPEVSPSIPRSPGHMRNFLDCVKSRALTESNLPYAFRMTTPMFMGRISLQRGGKRLEWDSSKSRFSNDEKANHLLGRACREPWSLSI